MENTKQETLEEFIERTIDESFEISLASSKIEKYMKLSAKWQQEQIGKSEFLQRLRAAKSDAEARRLIFEQFRKK